MARVGFFRVKQAARLLFCNNSAVTDGPEFDWDDIDPQVPTLYWSSWGPCGAFQWWKATWDMCATAALVEQVQLCRETYDTSCFLLYMLFINYCLYTVLQLWSSWNRNCRVLLFLYRCLTMVGSHLHLVTTWCLCWHTPFPLEVKRYLFTGGLKYWRLVHLGE